MRALIFSTSQLGRIVARIDGREVEMKNVKNHLWAAPWSPELESEGTVEVIAFNVQGKNATCLHKYNVNYTSVISSKVILFIFLNNIHDIFSTPQQAHLSFLWISVYTLQLRFG